MEHQNDSRFTNGFLLGLIVGAALVFLFGTNKGKRLLKTVSEEGWEGVSNFLEQQLQEGEDAVEEYVQEETTVVTPKEEPNGEPKPSVNLGDLEKGTIVEKKVITHKPRFFRRSKAN